MQVNPTLPPAAREVARTALELLFFPGTEANLPDGGLGEYPVRSQHRSGQNSESEDQDRRKLRQAAHEQGLAAMFNPQATQVIQQAEREFQPDSRAYKRQQARDERIQLLRQEKSPFGRELVHAAREQRPPAPPRPPQPSPDAGNASKDIAATPNQLDGEYSAKDTQTPPTSAIPNTKADAAPQRPQVTGPSPAIAAGLANRMLTPAQDATDGRVTAVRPAVESHSAGRVAGATTNGPTTGQRNAVTNLTPGTQSAATARPVVAVASDVRSGDPGGLQTTANAGKLPPPDAASSSDAFLDRILRFVRANAGAEQTSATLRLDPPALGTLRVQIEMVGDALRLQFETTTPAAQRLLSEELDALRQRLELAGMQIQHVEIRPGAAPGATEAANESPLNFAEPDGRQAPTDRDSKQASPGRAFGDSNGPRAASEPESQYLTAAELRVNLWA